MAKTKKTVEETPKTTAIPTQGTPIRSILSNHADNYHVSCALDEINYYEQLTGTSVGEIAQNASLKRIANFFTPSDEVSVENECFGRIQEQLQLAIDSITK